MIVQKNLMALQAHGQMQLNSLKLQSSLQKLSSGYRINSAADDAAGLAISERMRGQMTALERAMANAQDGISLVQTAEGAMSTMSTMMNRLTELATQASNGILNDSQRASLQQEADQLLQEMDRISKSTNFNGIKLLDGNLNGDGSKQVSVKGLSVTETAPVAGRYEYQSLPDVSTLSAKDSISFTLGLNNGTSESFAFTVSDDGNNLLAADGTSYKLADGVAGALADQMQKSPLTAHFSISEKNGGLALANRAAGTAQPQIATLAYQQGSGAHTSLTAQVTPPANARADIAGSAFTVFDGSNQAAATFSVNGEKFALVNEANYAETIASYEGHVNFIEVQGTSGASLTAQDLGVIASHINQKTGLAFQTNGSGGIQVRGQNGSEGLSLQVGESADSYNRINVAVGDMSSRGLGLSGLDFSSVESASRALSRISAAQERISATRGDLGATQNRLEYTIQSLGVQHENITAAESRIRDVDMAKEMMNYVRSNVLNQASQAMLAQANSQTSQVLQLLR